LSNIVLDSDGQAETCYRCYPDVTRGKHHNGADTHSPHNRNHQTWT
jgi:hypothetical protein